MLRTGRRGPRQTGSDAPRRPDISKEEPAFASCSQGRVNLSRPDDSPPHPEPESKCKWPKSPRGAGLWDLLVSITWSESESLSSETKQVFPRRSVTGITESSAASSSAAAHKQPKASNSTVSNCFKTSFSLSLSVFLSVKIWGFTIKDSHHLLIFLTSTKRSFNN